MSRVVFVGLSAYGHINPTLSIVKELILRGEEVIYIASNRYRDLIRSTGCKHAEFKYSKLLFGSHHLKSASKRSEEKFLEDVTQFYESIKYQMTLACKLKQQIQSFNPDYIIHDSTIFYIKYILKDLNIPCISSMTMFALNDNMFIKSNNLLSDFYSVNLEHAPQLVVEHIKQIEFDSGYKHSYLDNSMTKQGLNIVYTSQAFQPYVNLLDESYHFSGNNLEFRKSLEIKQKYNLPKKQKVVLISFGSIMSGTEGLVELYSKIMKFFGKYNTTFILNVGKLQKTVFDFIPNNFVLENEINQLHLLELADLFITHGGMNGVSEALQLDTPMIVIPQAMDQFIVAEQVEKTGTGKRIKSVNINLDELECLISEILRNQDYNENIKYIAQTYRDTGEQKGAVDKIFEYVGK